MDRNVTLTYDEEHLPVVAPLAGSVDRNMAKEKTEAECKESLPSRGAWIEI